MGNTWRVYCSVYTQSRNHFYNQSDLSGLYMADSDLWGISASVFFFYYPNISLWIPEFALMVCGLFIEGKPFNSAPVYYSCALTFSRTQTVLYVPYNYTWLCGIQTCTTGTIIENNYRKDLRIENRRIQIQLILEYCTRTCILASSP